MKIQRLDGDSLIYNDLNHNLSSLFLKKHLTDLEIYTCMLAISHNFQDNELVDILSLEIKHQGKDDNFILELKRSVSMVTMLNYYYKMRMSTADTDAYGAADLSMQSLMGPKISRRLFQMMGFCLTGINGASFRIKNHEVFLRNENLSNDQIHDLIKLTAITSAICKLKDV